MTTKLLVPSVFVLVLLLGVYGCNSPEPETATPPVPAEEVHDNHATNGHDHATQDPVAIPEDTGTAKTDMEKMTETLAGLPAEDRESAMKQHVCPVSGEMLGTMGLPKKVDVNGQAVWICCNGCKDKLLADPDKYLAKIAK